MKLSVLAVVAYLSTAFAGPLDSSSVGVAHAQRNDGMISTTSKSLVVDLGYSRYEGFFNTATGVNEVL